MVVGFDFSTPVYQCTAVEMKNLLEWNLGSKEDFLMSLAMESSWVFCPKQEGMGDSGGSGMEMYICLSMKGILLEVFRVKEEDSPILCWWVRRWRSILLVHCASQYMPSIFIVYLLLHLLPTSPNFCFWFWNVSTGESFAISNTRAVLECIID